MANDMGEKRAPAESAAPRVARAKPYYAELEAGRTYFWCACGRSRTQPYCDGSHAGTGIVPVRYTARTEGEEVLFCACKRTAGAPFCDGAHNELAARYPADDPDTPANRAVPEVARVAGERALLNGGCYVIDTATAARHAHGAYRWFEVIGARFGAIHQSQFYFETDSAAAGDAGISFGDRSVVLFVAHGAAQVRIGDRDFDVPEHAGVAIRPGESFMVRPAAGPGPVRFFATVGPRASAPAFRAACDGPFDADYPQRVAPLDPAQQTAMADRFFQVLVDRRHGSPMLTQFIGNIPRSKAVPHRHLYEESLIVLSGHGRMWTDNLRTPVGAGDVIFLPRKQVHSLECTDPASMFVVGVIFPGDNPAVNF